MLLIGAWNFSVMVYIIRVHHIQLTLQYFYLIIYIELEVMEIASIEPVQSYFMAGKICVVC